MLSFELRSIGRTDCSPGRGIFREAVDGRRVRDRGAVAVRLRGELDHSEARRLRDELDAMIDDSGAKRLLLDLSGLEFMDSSGIGFIIGRYKRMKRRGGSVEVVGSNPRIDRIFDMAGLNQLVERKARGRM